MALRRTHGLPQESTSETLTRLSRIAGDLTSEIEDKVIDDELVTLCREELDTEDDTAIESALTELKSEQSCAYDELLAIAEECAQTAVTAKSVSELILIPVLAWSRYQIPAGKITSELASDIARLYQRHFAPRAKKVTVANTLITSQQLPEKLRNVRHLLNTLAQSRNATEDTTFLLTGETTEDFSDTRYLVLSVTASKPQDLVSLSEDYISRARAQMNFCLELHNLLEPLFVGCVFEVQPPNGFFKSWRTTEAAMRVFALKSLVDFVRAMGYSAREILATSALFYRAIESETEPNVEVRVSIATRTQPLRVIAGLTWPTTPEETEANQTLVKEVLESKGVHRIVTLEQQFTMEWCEECGAPLYANYEGLITHIEAAEELGSDAFAPTLN